MYLYMFALMCKKAFERSGSRKVDAGAGIVNPCVLLLFLTIYVWSHANGLIAFR